MTGLDLESLGADVEWPDHDAASRTRDTAARSLGRLADLAEWLSGVQGVCPPRPPERVRVVVFGAAAQMEPAALADLAAECRAGVRTVDDAPANLSQAVAAGATLADGAIDSGTELFVAAYPDAPAATLAATVAVSVLTDTEPVKLLALGAAATEPDAWMERAVRIRDARREAIAFRGRPSQLLAALDQPLLAAAVGFVLQSAVRRTPVLLDGPTITAAALIAYEAQPRAVRWWRAADVAQDPAHVLALSTLGVRSVLDLGMTLNDGTAGLLALPILRATSRLTQGADHGR